jgi:hypothetical protein
MPCDLLARQALMPPAAKKLREELSWSEKAAKQFNLQLLSNQANLHSGLCNCGAKFMPGVLHLACVSGSDYRPGLRLHRSMKQADRRGGSHTSSTVQRSVLMADHACMRRMQQHALHARRC